MAEKFESLQRNIITSEPSLRDVLDVVKKEIMLSLNCHSVGTIQEFDAEDQTASISINYKKTMVELDQESGKYKQTLYDYPILFDCPVVTLQGGNAYLSMPIKKGDTCLIFFCDRDLDQWLISNQVGPLATSRMHAYTDALALVGLRSYVNPITDYDPNYCVLQNKNAYIALSESKIEIANATKNLKTILQNLVSVLSGITTINCVPGSPVTLSPSVISQLSTISSDIGALLE